MQSTQLNAYLRLRAGPDVLVELDPLSQRGPLGTEYACGEQAHDSGYTLSACLLKLTLSRQQLSS